MARPSTGGTPSDPIGRAGATSGATLAVATAVASLFSYAFALILIRALGPVAYGEVGALLGAAVIGSLSMTALQLEVARLVATGRGGGSRRMLGLSLAVSAATTGVALVLVPVLDRVLRLSTPLDAVLLAVLLFPQTLTGGLLGVLLGRNRLGLFAVVLVSAGLSRLLAAVATAVVHGGASFALAAAAVANLAAAALGLVAVRRTGPGTALGDGPTTREFAAGLARAVAGAGALMVLLNTDLLVARAVLPDNASGQYAFLTVFGRVTFWGTSFMSLWVFPRVAASAGSTRAVRLALGVVVAGGALAVTVVTVLGRPLVHLLAGPAYASSVPYAAGFAVAGALISVVQLATYVDVARARHHVTVVVWLGACALALACWLTGADTIGSVIRLTVGVLALVAVAGLALLLRGTHTRPVAVAAPASLT